MSPSEQRKKKLEKINEFFTDVTTPEEFARDTRRFIHESIKMVLTPPKLQYTPDPTWVNNGLNYLNMLCEVLHPMLEDEEESFSTNME